MTIQNKVANVYNRRGALAVLKEGIEFVYGEWIRPHLPKQTRVRNFNGIETTSDDVCWFDSFVPFYDAPWYTVSDPEYEAASINSLREQVNSGDDVVVIGAGLGITTAVAAIQSEASGSVVAFEGAKERYEDLRRTIKYNSLEDQVSTHHSIVAEANTLYGSSDGSNLTQVEEIPDCDVLEMDCEGAEETILCELKIDPRIIIVETHGNEPIIRERLADLGYEIIDSTKENTGGIYVITAVQK